MWHDMTYLLILLVILWSCFPTIRMKRYNPNWNDLKTRPVPDWWKSVKFGVTLHWGVYSVPGFGSQNFRELLYDQRYIDYMRKTFGPRYRYCDLATRFRAEFFNANEWAELFKKSKVQYVMITARNSDGYPMFPSLFSENFNSLHVGAHVDVLRELSEALTKQSIKFGTQFCLKEPFNVMYMRDKQNGFRTREYVYAKMLPELHQMINDYKPSVLWLYWHEKDNHMFNYYKLEELVAWLFNDSPIKDEVVLLGPPNEPLWASKKLVERSSQADIIDTHSPDVMSCAEIIEFILDTLTKKISAMLMVAPQAAGTIRPIIQERLLELGNWMEINGKAVLEAIPWDGVQRSKDASRPKVWYTSIPTPKALQKMKHFEDMNLKCRPRRVNLTVDDIPSTLYAIFMDWPKDSVIKLSSIFNLCRSTEIGQIVLLGNEDIELEWEMDNGNVALKLPGLQKVKSENAWTLRFKLA